MRALIQRVLKADVRVGGQEAASVGRGFLVLLGVQKNDTAAEAEYLARKTANLRVFDDENGKMNLALKDVNGSVLVVSQFTLAADTSRGCRPGFETAAKPEAARPLYEHFTACLQKMGLTVRTGIFQAEMKVSLVNDGPVTFLLEKTATK